MKSISFLPGASNFRLTVIIILVALLWLLFFGFTDKISIETEKASLQQTKNIINSSLVVVFATYAVKSELNRLNELVGANPFIYLAEYNVAPGNYHGEISTTNFEDIDPGWYYNNIDKRVIYKSSFEDKVSFFSIYLDYRDVNGSGNFEAGVDEFRRLLFK